MQAPPFWWHPRPTLAANLLRPLGALYGAVAERRLGHPGHAPQVPVICLGNPTVGGAGKTPSALMLARRLQGLGRHPVFLTRGYGGRLPGPLLVTPRGIAADLGDEPLLLARLAPTVVARDRVAGAGLALQAGADVIVMDDGFQNPALEKRLSILVLDAAVGIGNGLCLPAGPMRAPLAPQLARAQALLLVGDGTAGDEVARHGRAKGLAVLRGRLAPDAEAASRLIGRRVLAFAGIGRPDKFFATLRGIGALAVRTQPFPDHHAFRAAEAGDLLHRAQAEDLTLVTTEKDAVRLTGTPAGDILAPHLEVLPVRLVLEPESAETLDTLIARALA
ncbi:tetraacyldisaccharide 4'-kinase [Ancylobacter sp. 6x-1]|uniref:Tetraacyldisaccharide 4'-kinase n=1 Tax=Ancylobacter crimeensis TaxID=2579147 RepID=A0ABT0DDF2_9HYPH|nr:tetraacyldisaccharide 4'-kinase [Ancylobacter crimeensis]MCK0197982.1 tetraacyldisaccharide 4'-kinase [Ancylobacter crimeensis]